MYANGEGTRRDPVQAYKWYALAAVGAKREGSEEEPKPEQVQSAIDNRDKLASLLTDEQETLGQQLASDWWMKKYATEEKPGKQKKPGGK
jgi:TPR repeat protein